jgi:vacuolar-type H+-ATPase subunit H
VDVARVRGILDRLRPAGAPGGAARAGVPVDRRESLDRELAPVFAHLEPVLQECARITQEAADAARRRAAEADRQADDIVAAARTASEAERAEAATAARTSAARETERILAEARDEAQEVRRRGEQRRSSLVAHVVDLVRGDLRGLADDRGSAP